MWGYDYGYSMMGRDGFGAGGVLGAVFCTVFIIVLIVATIRFLRGKPLWHCHHHHHCGEGSALDILRDRYAHGEIDHKEFEEKKRDLSA